MSYLYHSLKTLPAPFIPLPLSFTSVISRKYKWAVAESCDSTVLLKAGSFKESSENTSPCIILYPVNLQIRFEIWSCYYVSVGWKPEFYHCLLTLTLGGIWGQEEKGTTEDEMAGWHHWLDGRESEWWTGRPGVLWFTGLQRVGHNWVTELKWTEALW